MNAIILAVVLIYSVNAKSILPSFRNGRIVGGNSADSRNFPYQALLEVRTATMTEFCGGSIISDRFILTSAHCVDKALWVDVKVGVKRFNEAKELTRQTFRVQKKNIFVHERFDRAQILNDISIVQLSELIQINEFVQTIKLPSTEDQVIESSAVMSGFGQVSDANRVNSDVLKYVSVQIMDIETCQQNFYGNLVNENNICTSGDGQRGACHSDYGGPLVVSRNNEAILVGVISFGWPICEAGKPTVHVDVHKYLIWIQEITNSAY